MNIAVLGWKKDGSKQSRHGDAFCEAMHPKAAKAALRYVKEFWESDVEWDFTEAARNRFKTDCVELRVFPSVDKQRAFVREIAGSRDEVVANADNVVENWDSEEMVSVDGVTASEMRDMLREIQPLCNGIGKAVPT